MIIVLEILFVIWIIRELCSVLFGFAMLLLATGACLASYTLIGLAVLVEMFFRLWQTAFFDEEG